MARGNERSLSDLKQDAELTRVEFTETVDQLRSKVSDTVTDFRERVSPDAIRAEVSGYFRTKGERLLDKARDNPLQAAAIGLGVAYPLLGILRSIPAPVLMVGAGLFLLGSNSGQDASRKLGAVADDVSDRIAAGADAVRRNIHDVQDMAAQGVASAHEAVSAGLSTAGRKTSAAAATLSEGVDQLSDNAVNLVGSASDGIHDLTQRAVDAVGATSDALRGGVATTSSTVRNAASSATEFGTDAARKVRNQAFETSQRATSLINETIRQNPLLIGGLALAAGMLIASALPATDIEKGIMGDASADLQKRSNRLASLGLEAAMGMASTMVTDVGDQAHQEGLTATDLSAAAEDLGRRVRKVAENATTTAFELAAEKAPGTA